METALENLSKEDLPKMVSSMSKENELLHQERDILSQERDYLKAQVEMLQRMQFGQKRERFEGNPNQTFLPFHAEPVEAEQQLELIKEKIEYVRQRPNHKGRAKLPAHLPVEEIEIHPEGDLSEMVCIGQEITEELECEPAKFYIKRYIRYKYAAKNRDGVSIAELPERVIDKGIAGPSLLAMILVGKYQDHLPLYRQKQIFARENIQIPSSTIEGWTRQALEKLEPLYEQLVFDPKAQGYLQVDETPIKVLDSDKKGAAHQGYYWVYHSPLDKTALFDYNPSRGGHVPTPMLDNFKGYLQTDGYADMGKWIFREIKNTLPKSQIGKAMAYAYARWDMLSEYLRDGNLQIDNNLIENAISPSCPGTQKLAVRRKS